MSPEMIINVTEADFEYEVLTYSQNTPVVVDFWAPWCRPCKTLGPLLEQITIESGGAFRLAKLDVDANPNLAMQYGVRTIPTVKAFSQGQVVGEFVGAQPENRVRDFFAKITPPSPFGLAMEKADSLLKSYQWQEAEEIYRDLLEQNPDKISILLGLAKALLPQGKAFEAADILRTFPPSREYNQAQILVPLAEAMVAFKKDQLDENLPLDAAYIHAVRLASRGNLLASLDGLLDILRQDKHYRSNQAHQVALSILELMNNEDPENRRYRNELASILF